MPLAVPKTTSTTTKITFRCDQDFEITHRPAFEKRNPVHSSTLPTNSRENVTHMFFHAPHVPTSGARNVNQKLPCARSTNENLWTEHILGPSQAPSNMAFSCLEALVRGHWHAQGPPLVRSIDAESKRKSGRFTTWNNHLRLWQHLLPTLSAQVAPTPQAQQTPTLWAPPAQTSWAPFALTLCTTQQLARRSKHKCPNVLGTIRF